MNDLKERIEAYIANVEYVVDQLHEKGIDKKYPDLIEAVKLYMEDAKYYLHEKKDPFTALACIAYAEGLIDGLRYLGLEDIKWKSLSELLARPKVLIAGGFEIIHPGHIAFIREAWKRGRVYVIVARDQSFRKFKNRDPIIPEYQRLKVIESLRYVYKAVLGDTEDFLKPVIDLKPDIIFLGPDQWADERELLSKLKERGLTKVRIERMKERIDEELYSASRIIKEIISRYCITKNEPNR